MTFPHLKMRRKAMFEDLSRSRVGLSEREVALGQRPHTGILIMAAGACGLSADPSKRANERSASGCLTGKESG